MGPWRQSQSREKIAKNPGFPRRTPKTKAPYTPLAAPHVITTTILTTTLPALLVTKCPLRSRGRPLQNIEGNPIADEEYDTAIDVLQQMYDNPSALRHLIYTELANLPHCDQE
ncbi:hypothetical protein GCK32_003060 [Trichostrongylus colubriformis]|uniref:Uncharacterized protein n=1 Tax=Trichostrongylus colubriformis TaxID=6319 RepID=A0AAN8FNV9_TRICO